MLAILRREESYGRFVPVTTDQIDDRWIAEHILKYPAEVVGAAWDDSIGRPEVVALIARLVRRRQARERGGRPGAGTTSMTLRLKVDRSTLEGHERTLVDALFFDGRNETSTEDVRSPLQRIRIRSGGGHPSELEDACECCWTPETHRRSSDWPGILWFLACAGLLAGCVVSR